MESKAILSVSSPFETLALCEADRQLSDLLHAVSQQMQMAMEGMAKMASDITESAGEIMDEMEKCKESANMKSGILDEERERFQKAAIAVIELLNGSESI